MITKYTEPIEDTPIHSALCTSSTVPALTSPEMHNASDRIETAIEKGQIIEYQKVNNGYYLLLDTGNEEITESVFNNYFITISEIKGELIKAGLWDPEDLREPSQDIKAANDLMARFENYPIIYQEQPLSVWYSFIDGEQVGAGGTKLICYCDTALKLAAIEKALIN